MTKDGLKSFLAGLPGAQPCYPFGEDVLVFKVGGKVFAIARLESEPMRISLKCDPELAVELREQFPNAVLPGYRLNKTHWNTVLIDGVVPEDDLRDQMEHSYTLVLKSLPRHIRAEIAGDSKKSSAD